MIGIQWSLSGISMVGYSVISMVIQHGNLESLLRAVIQYDYISFRILTQHGYIVIQRICKVFRIILQYYLQPGIFIYHHQHNTTHSRNIKTTTHHHTPTSTSISPVPNWMQKHPPVSPQPNWVQNHLPDSSPC